MARIKPGTKKAAGQGPATVELRGRQVNSQNRHHTGAIAAIPYTFGASASESFSHSTGADVQRLLQRAGCHLNTRSKSFQLAGCHLNTCSKSLSSRWMPPIHVLRVLPARWMPPIHAFNVLPARWMPPIHVLKVLPARWTPPIHVFKVLPARWQVSWYRRKILATRRTNSGLERGSPSALKGCGLQGPTRSEPRVKTLGKSKPNHSPA